MINFFINNLRLKSKRSDSGFTLVELLVTVGIIGILASIAIPKFFDYKRRAYDARAKSDAENVRTAEEAYYVDWERYTSTQSRLPGFTTMSTGVTLTLGTANNSQDYSLSTYHGSGLNTMCYTTEGNSKGIQVVSGTGATCP